MALLRQVARTTGSRVAKAGALRLAAPLSRGFMSSIEDYGSHVFKGAVADSYLAKQGLPAGLLEDHTWTATSSDKVAAAVMEWAQDKGATVYTHWFQPIGSTEVRLGMTGQVHNAMFAFGKDGKATFGEFEGKSLLKGETDGSSFPNGGMRATHTAGGYTILDPTSHIFLRGDTVYIPTVFVSFYGDALDEKTPLLRAMNAVSREGTRLLKHLGIEANSLQPNIGLEQEFFLVPRDAFYKRPDLQLCGRTIMGKNAPRGQEMCDHYMAPPNQLALACMQEIQHECFMMGIPLKTRHREVAPNQYEFAPLFGIATTQIDQNLMVMQVAQEVAARHNFACLFQEKPFNGVNGSGKHNNFSLGTDTGVNVLNVGQIAKAGGDAAFPVIMAAIVKAVDLHGDLMRMAIASPGNDFRLGAMEAPPAIVSTYLGDDVTTLLDNFRKSKTTTTYVPNTNTVDLGVPSITPFTVPAEDRNRTSPFPYGGHRFEFRAVGSSQNVSMVNTVLCSIFAEQFAAFSDAIEAGAKPIDVAAAALDEHWKVIFNGDGYSAEWPVEAGKRGVWRIDSGVEAMAALSSPKNVALFGKLGVLSEKELVARTAVMHEHYAGTVELEAMTMVDMVKQHVLPSIAKAGQASADVTKTLADVEAGIASVHAADTEYAKATAARVLRLETMEACRAACDKAEETVPAELWTLATYKELLFLDANQGGDFYE